MNCTFGSASILVCLPALMFFIKVRVNWSVKGRHLNKCSNHLQNSLSVFDITLHSITTSFLEIPRALLLPAVVFEFGGGYSIPAIKKSCSKDLFLGLCSITVPETSHKSG